LLAALFLYADFLYAAFLNDLYEALLFDLFEALILLSPYLFALLELTLSFLTLLNFLATFAALIAALLANLLLTLFNELL